jgi:lipopolysaccharide cholinephosphotransferase
MTEFQEKLLQTFKAFADFCKENNLKYYAAYGTCLGAVRHHGFIPWDDDMDVYMMRDDYELLMEIRTKLAGTIYKVSDFRDGDYPYMFAKFYSTDCTVWEWRQFPIIIGPWIDIFPIDEWDNSVEASDLYDAYHLSEWNYRKSLSTQTWGEIVDDIIKCRGLNGIIKLVKKCVYSPFKKHYFKIAINNVNKIICFKGSKYKAWTEVKSEEYEREWFSQFLDIPFEDTTISIPVGYDEYLTHRYGDYMTLPPVEKRAANHDYFFIDLHRKLTVEQILSNPLIKKEEPAPLSFKVIVDEIKNRSGFKGLRYKKH